MEKKNRKKRKILFIISGIVLIVLILIVILIAGSKGKQLQWVESAVVETANLSREITANGEIGSRDSTLLYARVSGMLKTLFVDAGDRVRRDDLVALVDDEMFRIQQQAAQAAIENTKRSIREQLLALRTAYTQAKTAYEQAGRNYENISQAHKRGAASNEQFTVASDNLTLAEQTFESARQKLNFREGRAVDDLRTKASKSDDAIINEASEVKEVLSNLNTVNQSLADCEIRSTIDGVITELQVKTGMMIAAGSPIATVHNPALLEVVANIDEVDISYVRLQQEAKIESDAFIGTTLAGRVSFIAPVIKHIGDSRVCTIKVELADPEHKAKIGASCSVFIVAEKRENVLAVPIESFIQEKEKKYAFKIIKEAAQKGITTCKVVKTEIRTGLMGIEKVEIMTGLLAGEEIVRENLKTLKDGAKVKLKAPGQKP